MGAMKFTFRASETVDELLIVITCRLGSTSCKVVLWSNWRMVFGLKNASIDIFRLIKTIERTSRNFAGLL